MADLSALQAAVQADPVYQAAFAQLQQDVAAANRTGATGGIGRNARNEDPSNPDLAAAYGRFIGAVQRSPLAAQLQQADAQVDPYSGQVVPIVHHHPGRIFALGAAGLVGAPIVAGLLGGGGAAAAEGAATAGDATGGLAPVAGGVGAGVPASVLSAATPVALSAPGVGAAAGTGLLASTPADLSGTALGSTLPSVSSTPIASAASGGTGILDAAGRLTGKSGKVLGVAGRVGNALGGLESGRAAGRAAQTDFNQQQDRLAQQRYQNELDAAKLNLTAPDTRMGTSVRGDILAGAQRFAYGAPRMVGNIPVPTSTGGLSPDLFSGNTRALGGLVSAQQLAAQRENNGNVIAPPPALTPMPTSGAGDSILNTAATLGNFSDLFSPIPYVRKKTGMTGGANG